MRGSLVLRATLARSGKEGDTTLPGLFFSNRLLCHQKEKEAQRMADEIKKPEDYKNVSDDKAPADKTAPGDNVVT